MCHFILALLPLGTRLDDYGRGWGFMGILHVLLAQAWGASKIILSEPNLPRRALAEELGAIVCDPNENVDLVVMHETIPMAMAPMW